MRVVCPAAQKTVIIASDDLQGLRIEWSRLCLGSTQVMISCERQKTWKAKGIVLALGLSAYSKCSPKKERACMAFMGINVHNAKPLSI